MMSPKTMKALTRMEGKANHDKQLLKISTAVVASIQGNPTMRYLSPDTASKLAIAQARSLLDNLGIKDPYKKADSDG